MRIGWKLTLALIVPLVALTVALGYLFQKRSRELLREELAREGRAIARVVQIASEDYLRDRQVRDLRLLADRITGYERVLGVRLFDETGALQYQSTTLAAHPFSHWSELRRVLEHHHTVEYRRVIGDQPVVGFLVPLLNRRGRLVGAVQLLQLESYIQEDERATRDFILVLTLAMMAATVLTVLVAARLSISRPIQRLVRSFRDVGGGAPARVPVRGNDEFTWLSREFNGMCERLESTRSRLLAEQEQRREVERRLRNAERLAGLGRLAAGLAHEIGTPLNVIGGRAESLRRTLAGDERAERQLGIVVAQTERIVRIVRDMLDFARMKPPRRIPTDVRAVVHTVLELIDRQIQAGQVRAECRLPEPMPTVLGDPDQLQQVFLNLALNALDAMPGGGRLTITARSATLPHPARGGAPGAWLAVSFVDTGSGIRPEDRNHVFDPFFTTKAPGRGTGLGLAVSYGIVEELGGWFELDSEPGRGTTVTAWLPLATAAALATVEAGI